MKLRHKLLPFASGISPLGECVSGCASVATTTTADRPCVHISVIVGLEELLTGSWRHDTTVLSVLLTCSSGS